MLHACTWVTNKRDPACIPEKEVLECVHTGMKVVHDLHHPLRIVK